MALAAQKTLENVIAGASLIFDQAVRVGDTLKMGDVVGTVDHIGLRSTRIRTLDRTIVSIPNGQIANASLETLSARDRYKFRHVVGLRYETTSDQLRAVVDSIQRLLDAHPSADRASVRVRFFQLGAFSLDVEVCLLFARDWDHFLEMQEALLFKVTETVGSRSLDRVSVADDVRCQRSGVRTGRRFDSRPITLGHMKILQPAWLRLGRAVLTAVFRSRLINLTLVPRCERAWRASHATGARRRSGARERV